MTAAEPGSDPQTACATARVTVVVPCYNQAHFLSECLSSLLAQTISTWEAIVVDDRSPDGDDIRKVVEGLGDARIRVERHAANKGLGGSRNTGIRGATTEFVLPVDADDWIVPKSLELMLARFDQDPGLDCVYADVQLFGQTDEVLVFPGPPAGKKMLCAEDTIPGAGTMMKRALWDQLGGYDEHDVLRRGREDFEFWIRAFDGGCRAARLEETLYQYRILPSSMNISCRLQDDVIAEYIYSKHKQLFDDAGETKGFLRYWTDKAATACYQQGMHGRAVRLALKSWRMDPTRARLKGAVRAGLPHRVNRALGEGELRRLVPFAKYPMHGKERHRPFFVIGVMRSGDKRLGAMLSAHPELHVPPETSVLGACIRKFRRYGSKLTWPDLVALLLAQFEFHANFHQFEMELQPLAQRLSGVGRHDRNLAFVLDAFFRHHASMHAAAPTRWGDRSPINSIDDATQAGIDPAVPGAGLPETLVGLAKVFPDAQFLHVYRDGCDLIHSHLRGGIYPNIEQAAKRWLHGERQARRFVSEHATQSLSVRYEDLIAKPEPILRGVSQFLGVDFDPAMLVASAPSTNPGHPGHPGKGRRNFNDAEKAELEGLIGPDLAELGYPPATAASE